MLVTSVKPASVSRSRATVERLPRAQIVAIGVFLSAPTSAKTSSTNRSLNLQFRDETWEMHRCEFEDFLDAGGDGFGHYLEISERDSSGR